MTATASQALKPYDVCVMSDASIQATIRVLAESPEQAGEEALSIARSGDVTFDVCEYDRRYYLPDGVDTAVTEVDPDDLEVCLEQVFLNYLDGCVAISVDGAPPVTTFEKAPSTGKPDDQILRLSWWQEGQQHSTIITLASIRDGRISDGMFYSEDYEGEPVQLQFFGLAPLQMQ